LEKFEDEQILEKVEIRTFSFRDLTALSSTNTFGRSTWSPVLTQLWTVPSRTDTVLWIGGELSQVEIGKPKT